MAVNVSKGSFDNRQDAIDEITSLNLFARDGAMTSGDLEDVHWHKTSLKIYLLEGSFETRDEANDLTLMAGPGDIITIPANTLHAARCPIPARYVVGFENEEAARNFRPEQPENLNPS